MNDTILNEIEDMDQYFNIKRFLKNKGIKIILNNDVMSSIVEFYNPDTKITITILENDYLVFIKQSSTFIEFSFEYDDLEDFFYFLKNEKKEIILNSKEYGITKFLTWNKIKNKDILKMCQKYEFYFECGFDIIYTILLFSKILMYSYKNIDLFEETINFFLN